MKKTVSILLICLIIFSFVVPAYAVEPNQTFTFDVSAQGDYDDPHDIVAEAGATITVVYRLTVDSEAGATAITQNEINYDSNFFTFVEGSISANDKYGGGMTFSNKQRLNGESFVFFNNGSSKGFSDGIGENPSIIGTFQLAIKKNAVGSSAVTSRNFGAKTTSNQAYGVNAVNLRVTVAGTAETIPVTEVQLDKSYCELKEKEQETLTATVSPSNATNKGVVWSSSNNAVAAVDSNGIVTAKAEGTAVITAKTQDGGKTASCTVTVTKEALPKITASCGIGGTITPSGEQSVKKGEDLAFFFKANENYAIKDVKIDGVSDAAAAEKGSYSFSKVEKNHTISVTFERTDGEPENPFNDVKETDYFYDAVLWAYYSDPQITTGTTTTKFGPDSSCTRGQVATFLWRACGCPEPKTQVNPFTDVKPGQYWYKPILWAVEQGITNGTSATTFSPGSPCRNSHILTFIWRAMGEPGKIENAKTWYSDALNWAMNNDLLSGTYKGDFDVTAVCPRCNVVEYLYRYSTK